MRDPIKIEPPHVDDVSFEHEPCQLVPPELTIASELPAGEEEGRREIPRSEKTSGVEIIRVPVVERDRDDGAVRGAAEHLSQRDNVVLGGEGVDLLREAPR